MIAQCAASPRRAAPVARAPAEAMLAALEQFVERLRLAVNGVQDLLLPRARGIFGVPQAQRAVQRPPGHG